MAGFNEGHVKIWKSNFLVNKIKLKPAIIVEVKHCYENSASIIARWLLLLGMCG